MKPYSPPLSLLFSLFLVAQFALPAQAIDVDAVFRAFGFEKKSSEEKALERFAAYLSKGEREKAVGVLIAYTNRSQSIYKKSPTAISYTTEGRPIYFYGSWDHLFNEALSTAPPDSLSELFEILAILYGPEHQGAGLRYRNYNAYAVNRMLLSWFPKGGRVADRLDGFLLEFDSLSNDAKVFASYQLAMFLTVYSDWQTQYGAISKWVVSNEDTLHPALATCLRMIAATSRIKRDRRNKFHLPNTYDWDALDAKITPPLLDESVPPQLRFLLAYHVLYHHHVIEGKEFLRNTYALADRCETEFHYPPSSHERYGLHLRTAEHSVSQKTAQIAYHSIKEWAKRVENSGEFFTKADLQNNEVAEVLKIYSKAGEEKAAAALAQKWVVPRMKHDLDVIFPLIEVGEIETAIDLLPAADEVLPSWRGGQLRAAFADKLPDFYSMLNDPIMELRLEGEIASFLRTHQWAFSPNLSAMERTREKIPLLREHVSALSDRGKLRVLGGFGSHTSLIPELADFIEEVGPEESLRLLHKNNSDLGAALSSVNRYTSVRFTAAFIRKDWETAESILEEIDKLHDSTERNKIPGIYYWITLISPEHAIRAVLEWEKEDLQAAAVFWKKATERAAVLDSSKYQMRLFYIYTQLFYGASSRKTSKDKWFGSLPTAVEDAMEAKLRTGFSHISQLLWYMRSWYSTFDHPNFKEETRELILDRFIAHPALYQLDQWREDTYDEFRYFFSNETLRDQVTREDRNVVAALFLAQARCRSEKENSEKFTERISDLENVLSRLPATREKPVDLLRKVSLLAMAEDCITNASLEKAMEILDAPENWASHSQLKKEYERVRKFYEDAQKAAE